MLTKVRRKPYYPPDIEEVEYPDEFLDELDAEAEIASMQLKRGELISLEDLVLKYGVDLKK
jgi:hypothetical protein